MQKKFKSVQDWSYLNTHWPPNRKYLRVASFGQLISYGTEFVAFSMGVYIGFGKFLPAPIGLIVSLALGALIAFVIEGMLRITCKDAAQTLIPNVVVEARKVKWMFFGIATLMSWGGSIGGSVFIGKWIVPEPTLVSTIGVDTTYQSEISLAKFNFSSDSLEVYNRYNDLINAERVVCRSKVATQNSYISTFKAKEKLENVSYVTRIKAHYSNIAKYKQVRDLKIANLKVSRSEELKPLRVLKTSSIAKYDSIYTESKGYIKTANRAKKTSYEKAEFVVALVVGCVSIVSVPFLLFALYVREKIFNKAGVEFEHHFSDTEFDVSILEKFWFYLSQEVSITLDNKLNGWAIKRQAKRLEKKKEIFKPEFYEYSDLEQKRTIVEPENPSPIEIPAQTPKDFVVAHKKTNDKEFRATVQIGKTKQEIEEEITLNDDKFDDKNIDAFQKNVIVDNKVKNKNIKSQEKNNDPVLFSKTKSEKGAYVVNGKKVIQHVSQKRGKSSDVVIKEFTKPKVVSSIGTHKKRATAAKKSGKKAVEENNWKWVGYWKERLPEFDE